MAKAQAPLMRSAAPQARAARVSQWLRRAANPNSSERQTLTLIGKSALVASVSWYIAHDLIGAQSPAFAPFSAVLIVQITAYQSLLQALRHVGAVSVGVSLQGAFGAFLGPNLLSFVLVALIAAFIGRWRRLGPQGSQVTTAAFFAFSTYAAAAGQSQGLRELGQIVLLVLIGCGVGVVVNVLVLPPMRYRSAEDGIHVLGQSLGDLAEDVCAALRRGELDKESTERWRYRAAQLGPMTAQAQTSVQTARESVHYHPWRVLGRWRGRPSFTGYQEVTDALERITYQMTSMTRSFDQWHDGEDRDGRGYRWFLVRYGDFLSCFAAVAEVFGRLDEDRLGEQCRELGAAVEELEEARGRLAEAAESGSPLPVSDPSEPYGILLAEAVRLLDEVEHAGDVLEQAVDRAGHQAAGRPGEGAR
ncbi:FUSC family protein [Streptomyces marispadix]|uniref:Aromatic acid exporter family protein n=1 Tax=Streptomyces marispadix TaxID=2922868 RepID=A0ABS9SX03_9ACTN|nr:aromatic acid exporter family protein [Streptomyces marispadix]MCH6160809.1 aromatic acid exporter family protein [Streptomyces marispadix]